MLEGIEAVRFVCSGNMVRSAYAELLARHLGCALPVDSCGTTYRNPGLHPRTRAALLDLGVERSWCDGFRPRHLDDLPEDGVRRLVLCMTPAHVDTYRRRLGGGGRVLLLDEVAGSGTSIADPVLEDVSFEAALGEVRLNVFALVALAEGG